MSALEKTEERKYVKWVKAQGGRCVKLNTLGPFGTTGEPDRMTVLKHLIIFMEFKRRNKVPTKLQASVHKHYKELGFKVYVIFSAREAIHVAKAYLNGMDTKEVSESLHQIRIEESSGRLLSRTRVGKDKHRIAHLQDTKAARHRRRVVRVSKPTNRVRRLAARDKKVGVRTQHYDTAWSREGG